MKSSQPFPFNMETTLQHLVEKGFSPRVVLDVGAAKGYWSELAGYFFPQATFYLLEPLKANEPRLQELCRQQSRMKYFPCAAGEKEGEHTINVTPDLVASSMLPMGSDWKSQPQKIQVTTINELIARKTIEPPQLVKMDVQGYELKVLQGGNRLFASTEVFILEVSLYEIMPGCPLLHEVMSYMAKHAYVVFDIAGLLRRPFENDLGQLDLVFVKRGSRLVASTRWS